MGRPGVGESAGPFGDRDRTNVPEEMSLQEGENLKGLFVFELLYFLMLC